MDTDATGDLAGAPLFTGICTTNHRNHCGVRRISGNLPGRGVSGDCGAAGQKGIRRRCRKAMHAEHADLPCGSKTVDHAFDMDGHALPASSPGGAAACPHPRVLRASPCCICVEILALRCRGPMLAHPLPGPRRRTRFWRYTLALRVYGPRFGCGHGCAVSSAADYSDMRRARWGRLDADDAAM